MRNYRTYAYEQRKMTPPIVAGMRTAFRDEFKPTLLYSTLRTFR